MGPLARFPRRDDLETGTTTVRTRTALIPTCLLLALPGFAAGAEPPAAGGAAAGKFYVVQADGRSRLRDPVREGVAIGIDKRLSGSGQPAGSIAAPPVERSPPATGLRATPPATIRITGVSVPPGRSRDEFAAFRCEQHGLYYTRDGRCVIPAARKRTGSPR